MNQKKFLVVFLSIAILAVAGFLLFKSNEKKPSQSTTSQNSNTSQASSNEASTASSSSNNNEIKLTKAEVEKHSTADSCWTIIDGIVYDITSYVSQHPGGDEILRACGIDGTSLFNQRETSSGESIGSGTPHSLTAQSQLEQFKLGNLQ